MAIYFSSDFHFGHRNIARGTSVWKSGYRDFDAVWDMDEELLRNINTTVEQDDTLYYLGDFVLGSSEHIKKYRERIVCRNIHFVLGNHDKELHKGHGRHLFTSVSERLRVSIEGTWFILDHYAARVWNGSHRGAIQLHGHSHDSLRDEYYDSVRTMDVGVDTAKRLLGEYRPFSLEEIMRIMDKRGTPQVDHHE